MVGPTVLEMGSHQQSSAKYSGSSDVTAEADHALGDDVLIPCLHSLRIKKGKGHGN